MKQEYYKGVYGIIALGGCLITLRKKRGPYYGRLDLPGGGIHPGETHVQTLERELAEEVGCTVKSCTALEKKTHKTPWNGGILVHEAYLYFIETFTGERDNFICCDQEEGSGVVPLAIHAPCTEPLTFIAHQGLNYLRLHNKESNKIKKVF